MPTKIVMPRLSLAMKEGTIGKWYKKEGEHVEKNEPVVEILSEKATYDLESPASGILRKIYTLEGVTTQVGETIAIVASQDEELPEPAPQRETSQRVATEGERVLASPAAKRLARELNVDLKLIKGSGPEGRVAEEDVRRFANEGLGPRAKVKETIPLQGFRKVSAERVSASFRTAPHSTLFMDVDMSNAVEVHGRDKPSYTAMVLKAVALALKEHPLLNSSLVGNKIEVFEEINIGMATATEQGLVVPIVHNVDRLDLRGIDDHIRELAKKARDTELTKKDLTGGTFTVTNLGMYGVGSFTPIINPPEAAILGVGAIVEKPAAISGVVQTRPMLTLSLSYDHRIVDGAPAADFLRNVKEKIEKATFSER